MSESAFGVDHGDISKAGMHRAPGMPKMGNPVKPLGAAIGGGVAGAGKKLGGMKPPGMMKPMGKPMNSMASRLQTMGAQMQKRPGLTGGAAAGGVGMVGAGSMYGNRNKRPGG